MDTASDTEEFLFCMDRLLICYSDASQAQQLVALTGSVSLSFFIPYF